MTDSSSSSSSSLSTDLSNVLMTGLSDYIDTEIAKSYNSVPTPTAAPGQAIVNGQLLTVGTANSPSMFSAITTTQWVVGGLVLLAIAGVIVFAVRRK